ncbi:MAG: hypothetical protein HC878_00075 [Leptolyngbyaceae cyanobacterium SL_5_14]|nr:hypothetical protein [Leptolyngbyaceae cyanobacterium SL_5_14]
MSATASITLTCDVTGQQITVPGSSGQKMTISKARSFAFEQHGWTSQKIRAHGQTVELDYCPEGQAKQMEQMGISFQAPESVDEDELEPVLVEV